MQMTTYLSFRGQCEEAIACYQTTLGARIGEISRYAGTPMANDVPADWQNKIMHCTLTIGDQVLMAGDVAPERYEEPKGFSLSLQMNDAREAERVFKKLEREGRVLVRSRRPCGLNASVWSWIALACRG
jgi:PhnB protein